MSRMFQEEGLENYDILEEGKKISNEFFFGAFFYPQSLFAPYHWIIRHHSHFLGN